MKTKQLILTGIVFFIGIFLGRLFFKSSSGKKKTETTLVQDTVHAKKWTCVMHRQVIMNKPGKCPICGMTLVPADSLNSLVKKGEIYLSKEAVALADIETTPVMMEVPKKNMSLAGSIQADEQLIFSQTAHVSGRIDKLYIDFTGQPVVKGQKLAQLYSPDLITAQKELIEAMKDSVNNSALYRAAVQKLKAWKLSNNQITEIEKSQNVQTEFSILSDFSGIVTQKMVAQGNYVKAGDVLFQITDISHVWVVLNAYQTDLPWLRVGDKIRFTTNAMPDKTFSSVISFISPVVTPQAMTTLVRAEVNNPDNLLKPGMFVSGQVACRLNIKGSVLVVPKTAVLWTGKRSLVYVKDTDSQVPAFALREITLSADLGSYYVVKSGLTAGESVVSNGTFQVDAAAQLAGRPSMMNVDTGSYESKPTPTAAPDMANMTGM